ncbi:MAG: hypothetical protein ACFFCS_01820 [Candidatus Hodarchaeota archaeon]
MSVSLLTAVMLSMGIIRLVNVGFNLLDADYIGNVALFSGSLFTTVHLWSRLPFFESVRAIKRLFLMMGWAFIFLSGVFFFFIVEDLLPWAGLMNISRLIGNRIGNIHLGLFISPEGVGSMAGSDPVWFSLILLGISLYTWTLERFVKNRKPWFAISSWLVLLITITTFFIVIAVPWLVVDVGFNTFFTLLLLAVVSVFLINSVFMFYLYISFAVISAGKMRKASNLVAIALILIFFSYVANVLLVDFQYNDYLIGIIGTVSLTLFNMGFFIMSYNVGNPGGLNKAIVEYSQSKRVCIVHRGPVLGRVFMCNKCNVFYCMDCKEAIVNAENKCWNCGDLLDKAAKIEIILKAGDHLLEEFKELKQKLGKESDEDVLEMAVDMAKKYLSSREKAMVKEENPEIQVDENRPVLGKKSI